VIEPQEMDEIERYKNELSLFPSLQIRLSCGKSKKHVYTCLERIARRVLAIPATTVPCERIFQMQEIFLQRRAPE
jgi:hypothetical protein